MSFGDHDEDMSDQRQFCIHGTFIGSWWGPDYMCGYCEDGISVAEMLQGQAAQRVRRAKANMDECEMVVRVITDAMANRPYDAGVAQAMVNVVLGRLNADTLRLRHLV